MTSHAQRSASELSKEMIKKFEPSSFIGYVNVTNL